MVKQIKDSAKPKVHVRDTFHSSNSFHNSNNDQYSPSHFAFESSKLEYNNSFDFNNILNLQKTAGNQAVQRMVKSGKIQTKLKVSQPGDIYEQEADRVAEEIARISGPVGNETWPTYRQTQFSHSLKTSTRSEEVHRRPNIMLKGVHGQSCYSAPSGTEEETEEIPIMGKLLPGDRGEVNDDLQERLWSNRGVGSPLPNLTRLFMESRFGYSFSDVHVHTDRNADQLTRDLNAVAFTTGNDVYFQIGSYNPETSTGKKLLAHELTHVVQQQTGRSLGGSTDLFESRSMIQRFTLKGFPPTEEAEMKAAVPAAIKTVKSCSALSRFKRFRVSNHLDNKRYDYKPNLGLCGWTFPLSWYIEVGRNAFNRQKCCDLPSTLAHEASHCAAVTESGARELECDCFKCSC